MVAQESIVLVAVVLINIITYCSAENVYCVTPTTDSCSSCPHNSTHCTTLYEYAQETELYFTSNTTMVFLPGNHALNMSITVSDVTRLTMCGESSSGNRATVVCSGSVGLRFTSMVEFKLYSLAFTSCGRNDGVSPGSHYALLLQSTQNAELVNCFFNDNLGTALLVKNTNVALAGNSEFIHNHCESNSCVGGGAIRALSSNVTITGNANFFENVAFSSEDNDGGGAIYASNNTLVHFNGSSNFVNNSAYQGGAICSYFSATLTFSGTINFINNGPHKSRTLHGNTARGGGVYMGLNSTFSLLPNTTVYWENNHASLGGAIFVDDISPLSYCALVAEFAPKEECFFQLPGQNLFNGIDVQLVFKNNTADIAGSVLYGGAIDNCKLTGLESYSSGEVFDMLAHVESESGNINSGISSIPFHICPCDNNQPNCNKAKVEYNVYPGETFSVSVVAIGQRAGTVPAAVKSATNNGTTLLGSQYSQQTGNTCTALNYTVFSLDDGYLELYADGLCSTFSDKLNISLTIQQICPPGFNISEVEKSCICEPRLATYTNSCTLINGVGHITRYSGQQFWVGYDNGLILHPHCPFDYCAFQSVAFPLNFTDIQCAYNRSRLLCGACKEGYSLLLGTSECRLCADDNHLALLILFTVMGVALVFFLLVCKLTVATGTLSGLLFYANVIGVNCTIFLPGYPTNVLTVFIAWLNLNFGIETCFYNGMDVYSKTWLQFVFPVYIWTLVGLMILVSHYSRRFARLLGNNPVSVLATLLLLSYTTIQHSLITIPLTYLEYPTYNKWVWMYDANIDYLGKKHIPLFLVAVLVFLFLFLPYTLLLLFGQWLQAISHLRFFSWVNRLKPFVDSYHAPYKAKHRY